MSFHPSHYIIQTHFFAKLPHPPSRRLSSFRHPSSILPLPMNTVCTMLISDIVLIRTAVKPAPSSANPISTAHQPPSIPFSWPSNSCYSNRNASKPSTALHWPMASVHPKSLPCCTQPSSQKYPHQLISSWNAPKTDTKQRLLQQKRSTTARKPFSIPRVPICCSTRNSTLHFRI